MRLCDVRHHYHQFHGVYRLDDVCLEPSREDAYAVVRRRRQWRPLMNALIAAGRVHGQYFREADLEPVVRDHKSPSRSSWASRRGSSRAGGVALTRDPAGCGARRCSTPRPGRSFWHVGRCHFIAAASTGHPGSTFAPCAHPSERHVGWHRRELSVTSSRGASRLLTLAPVRSLLRRPQHVSDGLSALTTSAFDG